MTVSAGTAPTMSERPSAEPITARPTATQDDLNAFLGRFVGDLGAALAAANVVLGDRLGLYSAVAANGPCSATEIARQTGTDARCVREWLLGQAAGGYVEYHSGTEEFSLTAAQAACLADQDSPTFVPGAFQLASSLFEDEPKVEKAFRTGEGLGWHEHHVDLFAGTERFFRPGYVANLVSSWIPAMDDSQAKLTAGASVADVGCGHGASTIVMAQAFPRSTFVGFDYHSESIDRAREAAKTAGVTDRVRFEVASASDFPGAGYDLIAMFDCLHDMGDPVGALRHIRSALDEDGSALIVEPAAADNPQDNLNPVGRVFFSASTFVCVPASRSQAVGLCLGAQAGPSKLEQVVREGGFSRFRVATTTPFNLVLQARP